MQKICKEVVRFDYYVDCGKNCTQDTTKVYIEIDYENGLIAIVDHNNHYTPQSFTFPKRGIEYMNGWLSLLQCLSDSIYEAKKKLEAYQKAEQDEKNNDATEILMKATELVEERSYLGGFGDHTDVSPCCLAPYQVSKSTRKGTRKICSHCGLEAKKK